VRGNTCPRTHVLRTDRQLRRTRAGVFGCWVLLVTDNADMSVHWGPKRDREWEEAAEEAAAFRPEHAGHYGEPSELERQFFETLSRLTVVEEYTGRLVAEYNDLERQRDSLQNVVRLQELQRKAELACQRVMYVDGLPSVPSWFNFALIQSACDNRLEDMQLLCSVKEHLNPTEWSREMPSPLACAVIFR